METQSRASEWLIRILGGVITAIGAYYIPVKIFGVSQSTSVLISIIFGLLFFLLGVRLWKWIAEIFFSW